MRAVHRQRHGYGSHSCRDPATPPTSIAILIGTPYTTRHSSKLSETCRLPCPSVGAQPLEEETSCVLPFAITARG